MSVRIVYFVHDLSDPSIHRRVTMLRLGNATVTAIGFRRTTEPAKVPDAANSVDLGQTKDAKLTQRVIAVVRALARLSRLSEFGRGAEVIVARNLEMLILAVRFRRRYAPNAKLVYECLDIHGKLLSTRVDGNLLRRLETRLWRDVDLLITSSPAFVRYYFSPRGFVAPIRVVENKVLLAEPIEAGDARSVQKPPWRIGWFGMIRCQKSLDVLGALSNARNGTVEIVVRGRPSSAVFPDFEAAISKFPYMKYHGQYRYPDDLHDIYSDVHFCWAIDYYEEGSNSSWLLPNRIYESGLHNTVPIALANVETGRWLSTRGIGVVLDEPLTDRLMQMFDGLDTGAYFELVRKIAELPRGTFSLTDADCREFVNALHEKSSKR